jgi:hypothetical protein
LHLALAQQQQPGPPCQPFAVAAYTQALHETYMPRPVSLVTIHNKADPRFDQQALVVQNRTVEMFTPTLNGTCDISHP